MSILTCTVCGERGDEDRIHVCPYLDVPHCGGVLPLKSRKISETVFGTMSEFRSKGLIMKFRDEKTRTRNLIEHLMTEDLANELILLSTADTWQDLRIIQADFINILTEKSEIMRRNLVDLQHEKDVALDSD